MLKNKKALMRTLKGIAENSNSVENRVFATALLYLTNEVIPKDRTTSRIEKTIKQLREGE